MRAGIINPDTYVAGAVAYFLCNLGVRLTLFVSKDKSQYVEAIQREFQNIKIVVCVNELQPLTEEHLAEIDILVLHFRTSQFELSKAALNSILLATQQSAVKKVIYLGSVAANGETPARILTNDSWNEVQTARENPYFFKVKSLEKYFWGFVLPATKISLNLGFLVGDAPHKLHSSQIHILKWFCESPLDVAVWLPVCDMQYLRCVIKDAISPAKTAQRYIVVNQNLKKTDLRNLHLLHMNPSVTLDIPESIGRLVLKFTRGWWNDFISNVEGWPYCYSNLRDSEWTYHPPFDFASFKAYLLKLYD